MALEDRWEQAHATLARGEPYEVHIMVTPGIAGLVDEARKYLDERGIQASIGLSEANGVWTLRLEQ